MVSGIVEVAKRGCCAWRLHSNTTHSYEALVGVEVTTSSIAKGSIFLSLRLVHLRILEIIWILGKCEEPLLATDSPTASSAESSSSSSGLRTKVSYEIADNITSSPLHAQPLSTVNLDQGSYVIMNLSNFNVKSGEEGRLFPLTGNKRM